MLTAIYAAAEEPKVTEWWSLYIAGATLVLGIIGTIVLFRTLQAQNDALDEERNARKAEKTAADEAEKQAQHLAARTVILKTVHANASRNAEWIDSFTAVVGNFGDWFVTRVRAEVEITGSGGRRTPGRIWAASSGTMSVVEAGATVQFGWNLESERIPADNVQKNTWHEHIALFVYFTDRHGNDWVLEGTRPGEGEPRLLKAGDRYATQNDASLPDAKVSRAHRWWPVRWLSRRR